MVPPVALPVISTRPCRTCRRFSPLTPEQMHKSLGDYAFLPNVRAAMASATVMGFCPVQHELREASVGCEHWEGRWWGRVRAWFRRRYGVDPDVALAERLAAKRRDEEHARLLARGAAARGAVPDPVCPVCKREHAVCTVCSHRRPTCGVCDVCGLEGVVVTAGANAATPPSWYCSRSPAHHGVGLPTQPPYPGGVCPGCREVIAQREVLEQALVHTKPGTRIGLPAIRAVAPALGKDDALRVIAALETRQVLAHRLGYETHEGIVLIADQPAAREAVTVGAVIVDQGRALRAEQIVTCWERV